MTGLTVMVTIFSVFCSKTEAEMKLRTRETPDQYTSYNGYRYDVKDRQYFNDVMKYSPEDANRWIMYRGESYKNPEPHRRTYKEKRSTLSRVLNWFFE